MKANGGIRRYYTNKEHRNSKLEFCWVKFNWIFSMTAHNAIFEEKKKAFTK